MQVSGLKSCILTDSVGDSESDSDRPSVTDITRERGFHTLGTVKAKPFSLC
jgi:hypothetical protein